jgi:hypothetical protein
MKKETVWPMDQGIAEIASLIYPEMGRLPAPCQYEGEVKPWNENWRLVQTGDRGIDSCDYRVSAIFDSIRNQDWQLFVLQVGLWGGMIPGVMGKSFEKIYGAPFGQRPQEDRFETIQNTIGLAFDALQERHSLEGIWGTLRDELDWSAVMLSKCLHFLARGAAWNDPVPVPIDNAMVRNWLWPEFKRIVRSRGLNWPRPAGIQGDSWESYNRYMTAIRTWAHVNGCSCMEVETALFSGWRQNSKYPPVFNSPRR